MRLGTLRSRPPARHALTVGTSSGSCDVAADAAYVDGARYAAQADIRYGPEPGASWVGRGRDRIYALCEDAPGGGFPGVKPGPHSVELRARVAGSSDAVVAGPLAVDIDCTLPPSGARAPAFESLAVEPPPPAPLPRPAPPPEPIAPDPAPAAARERGCGCALGERAPRALPAAALAAAALAFARRRRVSARAVGAQAKSLARSGLLGRRSR